MSDVSVSPVLRFPQWQEPLLNAVMEINHEKLIRKIELAETAIRERQRELRHSPNDQEESIALRDALSTLHVVRGVLIKSEELTEEEQQYLLSLLKRENVQEEDAELVLTLMRDHSVDVLEFIPSLLRDFPGLAKRLYHFCLHVEDKSEITAAVNRYLASGTQITEYQLFWYGMMVEDYLLETSDIGSVLIALYEHPNATDISRSKILEIPEKRFGLADLREEQLKTGQSDWRAWASAIGARVHSKGQRNQLLKYFRKSSPMNRLIGEFVEKCF